MKRMLIPPFSRCHSRRPALSLRLRAMLLLERRIGIAWRPERRTAKIVTTSMAKGGFGPDLAGRGLNAAQVLRAVRKPWGIMPAFDENQVSAKDAADIAAYFATLPKVAEPDGWHVEVPPGAPPGQALMINIGCGQCYGATSTARAQTSACLE